jgi:hypothetical protein
LAQSSLVAVRITAKNIILVLVLARGPDAFLARVGPKPTFDKKKLPWQDSGDSHPACLSCATAQSHATREVRHGGRGAFLLSRDCEVPFGILNPSRSGRGHGRTRLYSRSNISISLRRWELVSYHPQSVCLGVRTTYDVPRTSVRPENGLPSTWRPPGHPM